MTAPAAKVRVRFAKHGKIRFTSHRDVARVFERALRRARIPVRYTEGFSPRPKLSFGLALPTGHESEAEYLDLELERSDVPVPLDDIQERLSAALPPGMPIVAVGAVDGTSDAIQEAVTSCTWQIDLAVDRPTVTEIAERLLSADCIIVARERKGQTSSDDIRPQVLALDVVGEVPAGTRLIAELGTKPRTLRPAELLAAMTPPAPLVKVCRLHQWIEQDGARREPLPAPAAPHAARRAS